MTYTTAKTGAQIDAALANVDFRGFKNLIINGDFNVWQRGTSFSSAGYGADRWNTLRGKQSRGYSSALFRYYLTSECITDGTHWIRQYIEDVHTLQGKTVSGSFWIKLGATKDVRVRLTQNFGSGGSSPVTAYDNTITDVGTSWTKYTFTATLPDLSGKTIGSGSFLNFAISTDGLIGEMVNLSQVQLEAGPVATEFEQRPVGMELALCQRYYRTIGFGVSGQTWNTANILLAHDMSANPMRAAPTASLLDGDFDVLQPGATIKTSSGAEIEVNSIESRGGRLRISGFTELDTAQGFHIYDYDVFGLDAEL